jgi:hypothetical protein
MLLTRTLLASTATIPRTEVSEAELSPSYVHVTRRQAPVWWGAALVGLTLAVLLIHGYHPLAEDGGLYVAGIEWKLNPSLFPRFTEFVSEHVRFSVFASVVSAITRTAHLPLLVVLFLIQLFSITLMLAAARALLRRVTPDETAQLAGLGLLAALWSVPVAGTSLLLMDPYVTARSFSTPLSLWALAFSLDDWKNNRRSFWSCGLLIGLAAAFHPLMAGYALGLIVVVRAIRNPRWISQLITFGLLIFAAAALLQAHAAPDSHSVVLAAQSRYYWFLSQWHWYELFGLAGPLLVLLLVRYPSRNGIGSPGKALATAAIQYGCFAVIVSSAFAHESYAAHVIARLQPLRAFLMIYAVMLPLLGAWVQRAFERLASPGPRILRFAVVPLLFAGAFAMFLTEHSDFSGSPHVELPWQLQQSQNPWVRAFLWCRDNAPRNALFALDAHYITIPGEDAQTFRAIAQRSALPDFSKDGGEAAITPHLADEWVAGFTAQLNLGQQTASQLREHLAPFGVDWVILRADSPASLNCPYENGLLKVCSLQPLVQRAGNVAMKHALDVAEQPLARPPAQ